MLNDVNGISSPTKKSPKSSKNVSSSYPSPKKRNYLIKPDFSPILFQENHLFLKGIGSYKTKKKIEPESPFKTPNTDYFTPIKVQGKDLFGIKKDKKFCRKLNFDDFTDKELSKDDNDDNETNDDNDIFQIIKNDKNDKIEIDDYKNINNENGLEKNNNNIICKEFNDKMETDFSIIKTLSQNKLDSTYQVKENKTNKIYCLKKISEKTTKNNFNNIPEILENIQKENPDWKLGKTFCVKWIDYWIEKQTFFLRDKDINYVNKNIYILTEYYHSGDIFDYLEKLEKKNYRFTPRFYWDLIFEMIIGLLYIHKKGYIHFDIKPTNYLVDDDGYILLNDFGLSHKIEELANLDDIIEGDSKYISKELFECLDNSSLRNINYKTDIFSLGLSILEIVAKIDLPKNGKLWKCLRDSRGDILNEKFFINSNISNNKEFLNLIKKMISPVNKRPDLMTLINENSELKKRYQLLEKNEYKKESV